MTHDLEIIKEAKAALIQILSPSALTLVHLGLEYWAQCNAREALKIIERREKVIQEKQELIQKNIQNLANKSSVLSQWTTGLNSDVEGDMMDIREELDTNHPAPPIEPVKRRVAHASNITLPSSRNSKASDQRDKEMKELERIFSMFEVEEDRLSQEPRKELHPDVMQLSEKKVAFLSPHSSPAPSSSSSLSDRILPQESNVGDYSSDSSSHFEPTSESSEHSDETNSEDDSHLLSKDDMTLSPSVLMRQVAKEYEQKKKNRPTMASKVQLQVQSMNAQHNEDIVESLQTALCEIETEEKLDPICEQVKPNMSRFKAERSNPQTSSGSSSSAVYHHHHHHHQ